MPSTASPELQKAIVQPSLLSKKAFTIPKDTEEWLGVIADVNSSGVEVLKSIRKDFPVSEQIQTISGITTYIVTPRTISVKNANLVLLHLHGGAYVFFGGELALREAILMAHYGGIKVVSVDYRMPPEHPFPAALDDSVTVLREMMKTHEPRNIGIFGTSSGGGLALAIVHKLKELKIPLPAAIAAGTPWADLTKTGDTYHTNEFIDNALVTYDGILGASARLYAGNHETKNPLISPIYGDFSGFPPVILTTGTRDLFLSNTIRVHRKLRQVGIEAELQVYEGMSHAQYSNVPGSPESKEAFNEISLFFEKHLGK